MFYGARDVSGSPPRRVVAWVMLGYPSAVPRSSRTYWTGRLLPAVRKAPNPPQLQLSHSAAPTRWADASTVALVPYWQCALYSYWRVQYMHSARYLQILAMNLPYSLNHRQESWQDFTKGPKNMAFFLFPPTLFKENKLNIKDYIWLYHSIFLQMSLFLCFVVFTRLE